MAETDRHRDQMLDDIFGLKIYFQRRDDVYVSGNNFIYYKEGDPKKCVSPDVYVVFGVKQQQRDFYKVWEHEYRLPAVVFEHTSTKTQGEDKNTKLPLYQRILGIPEIFFFDPRGDYIRPHRLKAYRLMGDRYVELEPTDGRLHSEQLGLDLVVQGSRLRLYDPANGKWLLSATEYAELAQREAQRADKEARRAEREVRARQRAELHAAREAQRAEQEALARQQAEARAESGMRALQEAGEVIRRLQERLEEAMSDPKQR